MKMQEIKEGVITSYEGSIDEKKLDDMIKAVMRRVDSTSTTFQEIKDTVIDDYADSDISQVTPDDIVEIMDASFE